MKSLSRFFYEVFYEMKKINWPDRSEFLLSISATLLTVFLFSIFFMIVDSIVGSIVKKIITYFV